MDLVLLAPQASLADIIKDFGGHLLLANYKGLQLSSIENEATKFCTEFGYNRMENFQAVLGHTLLEAWAADYESQGMTLIPVSDDYRLFHLIECK